MSGGFDKRVTAILDAAYRCFARHGTRRTTMDDIAAEAGLSRPAVYQYMRNKDDVIQRLGARLFADTLEQARRAADTGDSATRVAGVLGTHLEMVLKLFADSPHHAAELLDERSEAAADYRFGLRGLLIDSLGGLVEHAELLLAFTTGLERGLGDPKQVSPEKAMARLRQGVEIFVAGMAGSHPKRPEE